MRQKGKYFSITGRIKNAEVRGVVIPMLPNIDTLGLLVPRRTLGRRSMRPGRLVRTILPSLVSWMPGRSGCLHILQVGLIRM